MPHGSAKSTSTSSSMVESKGSSVATQIWVIDGLHHPRATDALGRAVSW